jgi:hypothetical protein
MGSIVAGSRPLGFSAALGAMGMRMDKDGSKALHRDGPEALSRMEEALELIDRCEGTAEIGAHLDLAICRLRDLIAKHAQKTAPESPREPHL